MALAALGAATVLGADVMSFTTPGGAGSPDTNLNPFFATNALPMAALLGVGLLLSLRLPRNPVGWLLSASVLALSFLLLGAVYSSRLDFAHDLPTWPQLPLLFLTTTGWSTSFPTLLVLLPLLFPDGHLVSRRWRVAVWLTLATMAFTITTTLLASIAEGPDANTASAVAPTLTTYEQVMGTLNGPVSGVFMLALIIAAVASLVVRYRRAGPDLRHQLKWFVAAMAVAGVGVIPQFAGSNDALSGLTLTIGFTVVPVSIAVAVLRYRLYDIDVVISRALVYGSLAAFITTVYVGIVVGVGALVGSGAHPNLVLSIIATAIVAVAFQPVREQLNRVANRLVYGKRATPYEVLSRFSERVAETYAAGEALPRMARILAEGTGAERAAVWLRAGSVLRQAAGWPEQDGARPAEVGVTGQLLPNLDGTQAVAVRHQGELLGAFTVTKRPGEVLTPIESKLLDDLAHQAGLVLKNVGLTAELLARVDELRHSRQRLVAAQDEERRRLERNLHDGAQQNLVALKVKLGLAEALTAKDPSRAKELVAQLKGDADEALETLRDLARGIYPPLLADKGLAAALGAQARKATIPVVVETEDTGRHPQDIEAAVYFCVLEAMQNTQKYAGATGAVIRLAIDGANLRFEVEDNGSGFDAATTPRGAGLGNMADRLDALGGGVAVDSAPGGGTCVRGWLPLEMAVPKLVPAGVIAEA
ncbi:MAG: hypothetical protein QOE92_1463 [Chloroflexota bacterium]|nr:hypothetical protein [Chloroflexota bacterium]